MNFDGLELSFVIDEIPVASERVRKIPFHKGDGKLGVRGVTPEKSRQYMELVAGLARVAVAACPGWQIVVAKKMPVRVQAHFVRPVWRGDIDNLLKQILDACGQAGVVFFNDNRVVQLLGSVFTDPKARPRTEVTIEPVTNARDLPCWMQCALDAGWLPRQAVSVAPNARGPEVNP